MLSNDLNAKMKYLSQASFFSNLTKEEVTELADQFVWQEYSRGQEIIKQGQSTQFFYVIAEGHVESVVHKDGHDTLQINTFGPGNAFGEISLLTGNNAASTIRCLDDCRTLAIPAERFAVMLVRWPSLNQRLIEKLSDRLSTANQFLFQAKYREFLRSAMQLSRYKEKFYGIWGGKGTTQKIQSVIDELSTKQEHLLVTGESGTGREMMAWYIHQRRYGENSPFVVINGKHFDQQWGESIDSLLTVIEGGTLLIKEIHLLSGRAQSNLAESMRTEKLKCFVVGTLHSENQSLSAELEGVFAQRFVIKPLRERKRDIPLIAEAVLEKLAYKHNRIVPHLDHESMSLILSHNYRQGNTTELIQVIERAFSLAKNNTIGIEHIFFGPAAQKSGTTLNLLSWQPLFNLLRKGTFVTALRGVSSFILLLIIAFLILAPHTPLAVKVFAAIWGLWWPALVIFSPMIGRIWCTVCPFSTVMNFVQKHIHWNLPVPNFLKKYDYLFVTFFFLFIFWIEIVTGMRSNPFLTGILLVSILLFAVLISIIFTRHTWCKNLCPLGGLVGTASIGSLLEVRSDSNICLNKCTTLDCTVGSEKAPGCPMSQHLPYLDNNLNCKLCLNCIQNCPNNAVQLNIRIPAQEVWHLVRVNQGYSVFIGVSLAILIPILYFEAIIGMWPQDLWRLWFSLSYWGTALAAGLVTWLAVRPYRTKAASKRVKIIFAAIPLFLAGHIAYQLYFIPGLDRFLLGLGSISNSGEIDTFYVPFYAVGQILAVALGLLLSGFSMLMVLIKNRQKEKR